MPKIIFVLNGPNLNLLGEREPEIYGRDTLDSIRQRCVELAGKDGFEVDFRQTNFEGELVEWVHEARKRAAAIIINPAGLSFFSVPVLDALKTFEDRRSRSTFRTSTSAKATTTAPSCR